MSCTAAGQPVCTVLPALWCPPWVSEDIEGGWLRFWRERRVSEDTHVSVRLYFISSDAYAAREARCGIFLCFWNSGWYIQCIISYSLGFFCTEFVSSEEAAFINSFLLKRPHLRSVRYRVSGQNDRQQQDGGAFFRKLVDPTSGYSVKNK